MPSMDKLLGLNAPRRWTGTYHATVVDPAGDPEKRGRFRVRCPEVYGKNNSPWVEYRSDYGGFGDGGTTFIPDQGSSVFIRFKNGDPNLPEFAGAASPRKAVSRLAKGVKDATRTNKGKSIKFDSFREEEEITDPIDPFKAEYGRNRVTKTKAGHTLEFDDTPGGERIHVYHKQGTHLEMQPDGSMVVYTKKNKYEAIDGNEHKQIKGQADYQYSENVGLVIDKEGSVRILGNLSFFVEGDFTIGVGGNFQVSAGNNVSMAAKNDTSINSGQDTVLVQKTLFGVDI